MNPLVVTTLSAMAAQLLNMIGEYTRGNLTEEQVMEMWQQLGVSMVQAKAQYDAAKEAPAPSP